MMDEEAEDQIDDEEEEEEAMELLFSLEVYVKQIHQLQLKEVRSWCRW